MKLTDLNILGIINLRTLFVTKRDLLPNLPTEYVIYVIHNTINDKCYIGQARDFFVRFIGPGEYNHLNRFRDYCINQDSNRAIYAALKKYGCRNFNVYIIEELNDNTNLSKLEQYYIRELHTCIYDDSPKGYNMTWGGENCDHLHSPELIAKLTDRYGGDPYAPLHSDDSIRKANLTRIKKYGSPMGMCHTYESEEKAIHNMTLTKIFDSINYCLTEIRQSDEVISWEVYWRDIPYESSGPHRHIRRVLGFINELRVDSRWTVEMENIFSEAKSRSSEYGF